MTEAIYTSAAAVDLGTPPRNRRRFLLRVDAHEVGAAVEVPVHVIAGTSPKPRVALVAGVHGDEYDGIVALRRFLAEVDPGAIAGTLVVITHANPSAFGAGQRPTPIDGVDLNRVFPGRSDGGVTERLAHILLHGVFRHMDLVLTMHGARSVNLLCPWIEFLDEPSDLGQASRAAAVASGFTDLIANKRKPGFLLGSLAELGVPVIEAEVGGRGEIHERNIGFYLDRVRAVLRHGGLLNSGAAAIGTSRSSIWRNNDVVAKSPGIFVREVELSDRVGKGGCLGRILDRDGAQATEVLSPVDGKIGLLRFHAGVRPGDVLARIWTPLAE
ncbi:MAG: succinylglutamate desuccinylase/aspartoacylase family protein [Proteobacteria bacterium]|nr:succinylglutamate desuccinylase/aspartoacylase family protein [Pseudomonadota bacterium]MBI3499649.1 succinylglutamate desuccinylase/aspartoacylase family protein [Pseudomonadota bacterium]